MNENWKVFVLAALFLFITITGKAYAAEVQSPELYTVSNDVTLIMGKQDIVCEEVVPCDESQAYARETTAEAIVSFAKQFIGCRYVYGASGPRAFDCSGFTMYVMGRFGIKLPHSASSQSQYGSRVLSMEDLKAGDLVFFKTIGPKWISHVGIYVGEGNFIHSASRGVAINSLSEPYYRKRYVTAVRLDIE